MLKCKRDLKNLIQIKQGTKGNNYSKLEIVVFQINTYMTENDVIIGKIIKHSKDDKELYKCCSTTLKASESGFVDKVVQVKELVIDYKFVKVHVKN